MTDTCWWCGSRLLDEEPDEPPEYAVPGDKLCPTRWGRKPDFTGV